jgi:predicted amidohydrolase
MEFHYFDSMRIALATPPMPGSIDDCIHWIGKLTEEASRQQASIICFPESYIPGYPLLQFDQAQRSPEKLKAALDKACAIASAKGVGMILPMDWHGPAGLLNLAFVISPAGEVLGYQTKNQLDPSEDNKWLPGTERSIFEVEGVKFGIVICHEGFRYPESVRWAARNGAAIVFHPNCTGSDDLGGPDGHPTEWGQKDSPYYEKATMLRALENTVYFASVNYCFNFPDSATAVVGPDGQCLAFQPYRQPGVLVTEIDPAKATGLLAKRFKPGLY